MAQQTESELFIDAPAQEVLDVIADLEDYPSWVSGLKSVRVLTFKDVNVEELSAKELELPKELALDE